MSRTVTAVRLLQTHGDLRGVSAEVASYGVWNPGGMVLNLLRTADFEGKPTSRRFEPGQGHFRIVKEGEKVVNGELMGGVKILAVEGLTVRVGLGIYARDELRQHVGQESSGLSKRRLRCR